MWRDEEITILAGATFDPENAVEVTIEAKVHPNGLAIHPHHSVEGQWSVTHIASGMRIDGEYDFDGLDSEEDAMSYVEFVTGNFGIDWTLPMKDVIFHPGIRRLKKAVKVWSPPSSSGLGLVGELFGDG